VLLPSLYLAKIMVIPDVFQEFLRIFVQINSKIQNFEYEVIWSIPICTKLHQLELPSLYLVKAIPDLFQEFLIIFIQEKSSKILNFEYEVLWRIPKRTK
jgi:hypothetical protein